MGRPLKEGAEYFPHKARHGGTMFIIESQFGNDGYAAWFKILEELCSKEGHFIRCDDPTWEYLKSKTHLSSDRLNLIIDMLSKLSAIDPDLWSKRVIWCQHLVEGIAAVYAKRKLPLPQKPTFCNGNSTTPVFSEPEIPAQPILLDTTPTVSVAESTQREIDREIIDISKISGTETPVTETEKKKPEKQVNFTLPDWIDSKLWKDFLDHRKKLKKPMTEKAQELAIKKLMAMKEKNINPNQIIERSIEHGWAGLFEPNEKSFHSQKQPDTNKPGSNLEVCHKCGITFDFEKKQGYHDLCSKCESKQREVTPRPKNWVPRELPSQQPPDPNGIKSLFLKFKSLKLPDNKAWNPHYCIQRALDLSFHPISIKKTITHVIDNWPVELPFSFFIHHISTLSSDQDNEIPDAQADSIRNELSTLITGDQNEH